MSRVAASPTPPGDAVQVQYLGHEREPLVVIGEVEARPDRVIIYRGRLLHSGHIPIAPDPLTARESGRLTINTFLVGNA